MMVMPSYIGIRLPPGKHQVVVQYQSDPRRSLLLVFGLAVLLISAAAGVYRRYLSDASPGRTAGR
jgi:hypothetical protein